MILKTAENFRFLENTISYETRLSDRLHKKVSCAIAPEGHSFIIIHLHYFGSVFFVYGKLIWVKNTYIFAVKYIYIFVISNFRKCRKLRKARYDTDKNFRKRILRF